MKTRNYGRHGIAVSEIGLGGHQDGVETGEGLERTARFYRTDQERARVVGRAIDQGVTYFDTTFGCELASLGRALRVLGRREGLFVSAMRVDFFSNLQREQTSVRAYTRREVELRLLEFGDDQVDQFMLGAVEGGDPLSTPDVVEKALDELGTLRSEGKLRFIGFSCHDTDYAARMLTMFPRFDAVMTPYNFANRRAEGDLAAALERTGAAWIGMKPLVWHVYGLPVTALRHLPAALQAEGIHPDERIAQLALRFILQNPNLTSCVPAMNSIAEVDENVAASGSAPLSDRDIGELEAYAAAMIHDKGIPLAIGGLGVENLRVRHFALGLLARELGWRSPDIDWNDDDAEKNAREAAEAALAGAKKGHTRA